MLLFYKNCIKIVLKFLMQKLSTTWVKKEVQLMPFMTTCNIFAVEKVAMKRSQNIATLETKTKYITIR